MDTGSTQRDLPQCEAARPQEPLPPRMPTNPRPEMEFTGTRHIRAPRETVWARLNSPQVMREAIPGCTSFTGSHEDGYEAIVRVGIGPVGANFRGWVKVSDVVEPESYRLDAGGEGRLLGQAGGQADVRLEETATGTDLHYRITSQMGGRLGTFGRDRIAAVASRLADGFFARLMGEEGAEESADEDADEDADA